MPLTIHQTPEDILESHDVMEQAWLNLNNKEGWLENLRLFSKHRIHRMRFLRNFRSKDQSFLDSVLFVKTKREKENARSHETSGLLRVSCP